MLFEDPVGYGVFRSLFFGYLFACPGLYLIKSITAIRDQVFTVYELGTFFI